MIVKNTFVIVCSFNILVYNRINQQIIQGFGHHLSEENLFTCETCGKFYKSKGSLATHVSLNHGKNESSGQSFSCVICGKCYNTKNAMNTHKSRYHKGDQDQYFN